MTKFDPLPGQSILEDPIVKDRGVYPSNVELIDKKNLRLLLILGTTCEDGKKKVVDFAYID